MLSTHDLNWFVEFDALKSVYFKTLGNLILGIEHVGSTAVPELLAKPTLDIDLVMCDYSVFDEIVAGLGSLGYRHMGDQGIYQREVFKPNGSVALGKELHRHIKFRDALRTSADLRREYATIKKNIASRADGDRRKYAEIKESECGEFFERVLK